MVSACNSASWLGTGKATILSLVLVLILLCAGRAVGGEEPDLLTREEISRLAEEFSPIARVEFHDTDIRSVCKVVADTTGYSVFVSPSVKERVGVWGRDINPIELLDRATAAARATYVVRGHSISVMSWEEYQQRFGVEKRVVRLKFAEAAHIASAVQTFLSNRGKVFAETASNAIVLLETPGAVGETLNMIEALDVASVGPVLAVIRLEHADAAVLAERVREVVGELAPPEAASRSKPEPERVRRQQGPAQVTVAPAGRAVVFAEERTNSLVVGGFEEDVARIRELVAKLDVPVDTVVRNYPILHVDAEQLHDNLSEFMGLSAGGADEEADTPGGALSVLLSEQTNSVIVSAAPRDHQRVKEFLRQADVSMPEAAIGVRVYRLENVAAAAVAQVIEGLLPQEEQGDRQRSPGLGETAPAEGTEAPAEGPSEARPASQTPAATAEALLERPMVTVNEEANAVVIRATARQHEGLGRLIQELDKPRDQVMIEAIIVQVTASDEFALGVELESANLGADTGHLVFSSFGLSTVDVNTGDRTLNPGAGFNAVVLRPEYVPLIITALQSATNARVSSAPRLLVNDNAEGTIDSIQEEPFTTIAQGETTTTTTFAGFVRAGTSFAVTPHISKGNAIRLQYRLELNTFTDDPLEPGVPPPRATDSISSEAVVPDGHTIVIGGLRGTTLNTSHTRIPLLGDIPLLGHLFSRRSRDKANLTTFVFIRPTIIRGRKFETLRYLSSEDLDAAGLGTDYPQSKIKPMGGVN